MSNTRKRGEWPDGQPVVPISPYNSFDIAQVAQRMGVERAAIGHANYHGDVRNTFDVETFDGAKGPNYMGEIMFPVSMEYDEETDMTKVGYSLMPPSPVLAELVEDDDE